MSAARSVIFNIIGKDSASKAFLSASKAADAAATRVERTAARIQKTGAAMQVAGVKMSKAITLPVVAAAAVSVDQAAKFQKSMTLIQTAADESAKKTAAISGGVTKIATETGTSLDGLTAGIYTVAKAGAQKWSATGQLEVLKAAAQGAKAENVDLGTAVDALTTIMQGYGMKASDAVKAENMLIRGSGLAKTSMQEFAGSLANVVPLAASLKISFPQIAGAIATMTQHGETADRATQNLANLITHLAGQSHQSSAMMQQLGIDVVDLQQHLGKRGLTGTLKIVEDALAASSKGGRVVVDAFKHSQTATADLQTALDKMPPSLRKISQQFESGKMSYKDYRKAVKGLGADGSTLGLEFMSLVKKAKGFSDQLKSGDPTVRTAASTLQKMLGGVTGMRTALMLGGTSEKGFVKSTDEVAEAARKSGADVLGWSKTQGTLSVKVDKAKASLQVMAVEIGTALIPIVSKAVDWVSKAVHWFDNLSTTDKKFVGYSVVVLAALGPVLAIVGRITRAIGLMWAAGAASGRFIAGIRGAEISLAGMQSKAYLAGLKIRGMSAATRGLAAALGGAAIGYGIGTLTQNASTTTKAIGALGSAAAGAALGFAVGGPLGAGIGAVAGGLTDAAKAFHLFGGASKSTIKPTQAFTQAIIADNDALGENTRKLVENSLQKNGLYDAALKLGISQKTLTDAMMGNTGAARQVNNVMKSLGNTYLGTYGLSEKQQKAIRREHNAYLKLKGGIGAVTETLKVNKRAADNIAAADAKQKNATDRVTAATDKAASSGHNYLSVLAKLSGEHKITVKAHISQAARAIARIRELVAQIHGKSITISEYTRIVGGSQVGGSARLTGRASGGGLPEGLAWVGERGPELADKHGSQVDIIPNGPAMAFARAAGLSVPGFADGTDRIMQAILAATRPGPTTVPGYRETLGNQSENAAAKWDKAYAALARYERLRDAAREADKQAARSQSKADQKAAQAADKLATKAKSAYEKIKQAAQSETQVVTQSAQTLVQLLQQQEQAMAQNVTGFESTISQGLTAGSDLATVYGGLASNVDSAKQALDAAKSALAQATPDASKLAAAQTAQAQATAAQAAAHAALSKALAGGNPAQILAAQQAQTTAASNLAAAQQAVQAATPSADQLAAQAAAQQDLAAAQKAYNQAVQGASASGVASTIEQIQANIGQFAADLSTLQKDGAGQALITQLAGMGADAGDALAKGLINDPASLAAISKSMDAINNIAGAEGDTLAKGYYGAGVNSMEQLLAGIEHKFPSLVKALTPLAAKLAVLFTFTPTVAGSPGSAVGGKSVTIGHIHQLQTVAKMYGTSIAALIAANPSLAGDTAESAVRKGTKLVIPAFANGVTDFAGGLAYVHAGELLVNLPYGHNSVIPANRAKDVFGGADITPLVQRLDRIEARLADAPHLTGQAVGAATLHGFERAGQEQGKQLARIGRKQ